MTDVTALGELLIDFVPTASGPDGYPSLETGPGGAPVIFLAAAARYGASCAMIGKVGDDRFGRLLIDTLDRAGIDASGVVTDPSCFTTLAFVTPDGHGKRDCSFVRKPGADTRLTVREIDPEKIRRSRVFHFGTMSLTNEPARAATRSALSAARDGGVLVSLDPNLRLSLWGSEDKGRAAMEWSLRQADIVKISSGEIAFLWGISPEEGVRRLLSSYGVSLVYATMGAKGCYAANRNGAVFIPTPDIIRPVDTAGAGDIFCGAAMSRFLECRKAPRDLTLGEIRRIVRFACAAACLSTQKRGAIASIPSPEEVNGLFSGD